MSDSTPSSTIYYTLTGADPTTSSTKYTGPFTVTSTTTVKAMATATGFSQSSIATSVITIQTGGGGGGTVDFSTGFTPTGIQMNGHSKLNGTRLQLTDTSTTFQVGSAFWITPVGVGSFTNDFTFPIDQSRRRQFAFTIQNVGPTAIGPFGSGLGYGGTTGGIAKAWPSSSTSTTTQVRAPLQQEFIPTALRRLFRQRPLPAGLTCSAAMSSRSI